MYQSIGFRYFRSRFSSWYVFVCVCISTTYISVHATRAILYYQRLGCAHVCDIVSCSWRHRALRASPNVPRLSTDQQSRAPKAVKCQLIYSRWCFLLFGARAYTPGKPPPAVRVPPSNETTSCRKSTRTSRTGWRRKTRYNNSVSVF